MIPFIDNFFTAIEAGDFPLIRSYLERDPSLANAIDNRLRPSFEGSWEERQRQAGSGLVGEPPKPLPPRGDPALHVAVRHNQLEIVRLLVAHEADVNTMDKHRRTPLHLALTFRVANFELIRFLVENGADIKALDLDGRTPLTWAVLHSEDPLSVVEFLLKNGADVNVTSRDGRTVLVNIVLRLGYPWETDYVSVIETLLSYGANANPVVEKHGDTPLSIVAFQGCVRAARVLINAGADPNSLWRWGSALHAAAMHGSHELVELLLEASADPLALDKNGKTPLDLTKPYEETLERIEHFLNERERGES